MAVRGLAKGFEHFQMQKMIKSMFGLRRSYSALCDLTKSETSVCDREIDLTKSENSVLDREVDVLSHHDYFGVRKLCDIKTLFENRVHIGHKQIVRHPHMRSFLFGSRLGVDVINLDKTETLLGDALNFTAHIAYKGGVIMLLTRTPQLVQYIEKVALDCGEYSHCRKWKDGTFTNSTVEFGTVTRLPDLCVFFSTLNDAFEEHIAVKECAKMNIPTIGILDSNCDPRLITYPVPGNDDSPTSVKFLAGLFAEAIMKGKNAKKDVPV